MVTRGWSSGGTKESSSINYLSGSGWDSTSWNKNSNISNHNKSDKQNNYTEDVLNFWSFTQSETRGAARRSTD